MRAVAQRVRSASVTVDDVIVGRIDAGLLVYLGAGERDDAKDVDYMVGKLAGLRIFEDDAGKMSRSVEDVGGGVLVVSQFTLYGDVRRGRRPSFTAAAEPGRAEELYEQVVAGLRARGLEVATGRFRATMCVDAAVWGPVTILVDSEKSF
ncbi:MAG TPA: D-aminoacyl-tRNA deacylase [Polyangiaceae bacterium LLY-WYZ-15_(1-7)]|nr:D-tyrosyl-tRNA(Tyr) deacylase [Sandaracinus sp.]HJL04536.1 D-aminoacyl-tRNA deacylase [Polyangiaceae bacterium LLY-WYZ-15_(1-7)]HJL08502.1 D-aminoacyl-tRNA deacylase [Polyangiaceae bacterium LLY-WYZ-15_(1-7)]HJL26969.1 D-aminoacyl-tRNA deacylase [Polyangiaceae bacterium LLY-WYZ-15_(1-7)]HJL33293.1 D-aminoacyl-tRNA deacylase [Polyangiaceae bacterium LLY-WYZ-15_(1-7)]